MYSVAVSSYCFRLKAFGRFIAIGRYPRMAKIQFDDIGASHGQTLVSGLFDNGDLLFDFGDQGLADILGRISEDSHSEIKSIYNDVTSCGLGDFKISFDVDETCEIDWVTNLIVVLDGHVFDLGFYWDFAEHNGMLGLRYSYKTRLLWDDNRDRGVA